VVGKSTLNQNKLPCEAGIAITDALIGGRVLALGRSTDYSFPAFSGT